MKFTNTALLLAALAGCTQAVRLHQDEVEVVVLEVAVPEEVVVEVQEEAPEVQFAATEGSDLFSEEIAIVGEPVYQRRRGSRDGDWEGRLEGRYGGDWEGRGDRRWWGSDSLASDQLGDSSSGSWEDWRARREEWDAARQAEWEAARQAEREARQARWAEWQA